MEEDITGRSLLERCDKLLHSIAAITSSAEQVAATDHQPSPVSVLDSSFLSEENSASPLPKRSIVFEGTSQLHHHKFQLVVTVISYRFPSFSSSWRKAIAFLDRFFFFKFYS